MSNQYPSHQKSFNGNQRKWSTFIEWQQLLWHKSGLPTSEKKNIKKNKNGGYSSLFIVSGDFSFFFFFSFSLVFLRSFN